MPIDMPSTSESIRIREARGPWHRDFEARKDVCLLARIMLEAGWTFEGDDDDEEIEEY